MQSCSNAVRDVMTNLYAFRHAHSEALSLTPFVQCTTSSSERQLTQKRLRIVKSPHTTRDAVASAYTCEIRSFVVLD